MAKAIHTYTCLKLTELGTVCKFEATGVVSFSQNGVGDPGRRMISFPLRVGSDMFILDWDWMSQRLKEWETTYIIITTS